MAIRSQIHQPQEVAAEAGTPAFASGAQLAYSSTISSWPTVWPTCAPVWRTWSLVGLAGNARSSCPADTRPCTGCTNDMPACAPIWRATHGRDDRSSWPEDTRWDACFAKRLGGIGSPGEMKDGCWADEPQSSWAPDMRKCSWAPEMRPVPPCLATLSSALLRAAEMAWLWWLAAANDMAAMLPACLSMVRLERAMVGWEEGTHADAATRSMATCAALASSKGMSDVSLSSSTAASIWSKNTAMPVWLTGTAGLPAQRVNAMSCSPFMATPW
mmetsp:Transcript_13679/g.33665  ORF Transcript_13679/g.33665 Transcript_13679/m.33665 type:complete len:272 (-) Transcript_13679:971-1786(-)